MTTFSGRSTAMRRGAVPVQHIADRVVEHGDVDQAVGARHADRLDEIADRLRRHAAAAEPRKRRHARIVPAGDMAAPHKLRQHALRKHRVGQVEPRELVCRGRDGTGRFSMNQS